MIAELSGVSRAFKNTLALDDVSLALEGGEIHALLGPNGAGKTTLLRLLSGLVTPTRGRVRVLGHDAARDTVLLRGQVGLVPSGDRTQYLRLSGLENLAFFARLHGLRRKAAKTRALEVLADVGLLDAARTPVGLYSHGMQKRLSLARALLTRPSLLLVDEATHDLDPEGAVQARELVAAVAARGAAVLWTTQRLEEIRGFADRVTLLSRGRVRFVGTVPGLMEHASPRRFLLRVRNGQAPGPGVVTAADRVLGPLGGLSQAAGGGAEHYVLSLTDGAVLGDALTALGGARLQLLTCREERPEIEDAFLTLTRDPEAGSDAAPQAGAPR